MLYIWKESIISLKEEKYEAFLHEFLKELKEYLVGIRHLLELIAFSEINEVNLDGNPVSWKNVAKISCFIEKRVYQLNQFGFLASKSS